MAKEILVDHAGHPFAFRYRKGYCILQRTIYSKYFFVIMVSYLYISTEDDI